MVFKRGVVYGTYSCQCFAFAKPEFDVIKFVYVFYVL